MSANNILLSSKINKWKSNSKLRHPGDVEILPIGSQSYIMPSQPSVAYPKKQNHQTPNQRVNILPSQIMGVDDLTSSTPVKQYRYQETIREDKNALRHSAAVHYLSQRQDQVQVQVQVQPAQTYIHEDNSKKIRRVVS